MGGISKWEDAVEFMMAGAAAVQVGTANFTDPYTPVKIIEGLKKYTRNNALKNISEITGKAVSYTHLYCSAILLMYIMHCIEMVQKLICVYLTPCGMYFKLLMFRRCV